VNQSNTLFQRLINSSINVAIYLFITTTSNSTSSSTSTTTSTSSFTSTTTSAYIQRHHQAYSSHPSLLQCPSSHSFSDKVAAAGAGQII
jgi:hypothetical protein